MAADAMTLKAFFIIAPPLKKNLIIDNNYQVNYRINTGFLQLIFFHQFPVNPALLTVLFHLK